MNKIVLFKLLMLLLLVSQNSFGQATDLIISEYVEDGGDKYIEIYNGTGNAVDLSDYALRLYSNGNTSPNANASLSGNLAADETIVYSGSSSNAYSGATTTHPACNFNGNDAIALAKNGTNIDVFGVIGDDSEFAEDLTRRRKAPVCSPTTTYNESGEWDDFGQGDVSGLGAHTANCTATNPDIAFDLTASTVTEGNTGTTAHTVAVTMQEAPTIFAVTVEVTNETTAGAGKADGTDIDYTDTELTFGILESYPNTKTVTITVNGDETVEPDETIDLMLDFAATNVGSATIGDDMHQVTITNDDIATEINLATDALTIVEGGSMQLCVNISNPSAIAATMADIVLTTAAAPHFDGYSTATVTFPAGSTDQECITLATDAPNGIVDANKTYTFTLQNPSGGVSTAVGSMEDAIVTITDDTTPPLQKGLYVNEFSNGTTGSEEFVELVVTGTGSETVDLRGWIIDDNNGDFGGEGIADGYLRFSNDCNWENVPVGSIILLYNASDKNPAISLADDMIDANLDLVYVCPIRGSGNSPYFEGNTTVPNSGNATYPASSGAPTWEDVAYGNSEDAAQVRNPAGTLIHGAAYGATNNDLSGSLPYFNSDGTGQNFSFTNTSSDDFAAGTNWTQASANTADTPGAFNNAANQAYIESLRKNAYPVENTNKSRTCELGPNQSRFYFNEEDGNGIILFIQNNNPTDYGSSDASVDFSGSNNENTTEQVFQFATIWQFTPTTTTPANYNIRFYVPQTDWDAYVAYLNNRPNSTGNHTAASVLADCQIYTYDDADNPATATSTDAQSPTTGTYSADGVDYYTFEATFTHFSKYVIGMSAARVLPVELVDFNAKKTAKSDILLTWQTASEINNDYFILERSADGERFSEITKVTGNGTTSNSINYQFLDKNPANGVNYYRLKQVDLDGQFSYSKIVTEKIGTQITVSIRPNLVNNKMSVELTEPAKSEVFLEIYDLQGRLILTNQIDNGATAIDLNLVDLSKGTYVLKANDAGSVSVIRFVKM